MKKSKFLILTVLIVIFSITLCSCGNDGDNLIGTWAGTWVWEGDQISASFVLSENGQYARTVLKNGEFSSSQTGTWEFRDGELRMHNNGDINSTSVYEYRDGKLYNGDNEHVKQGIQ